MVEKPTPPPAPKPAPKKEEPPKEEPKKEDPKKEEPKNEEAPVKGLAMPEGNTEIPKEYSEIITFWYGPEWNRHSAPASKDAIARWFKKDDELDKQLTDKFKTDIEELAKGNKEEMRKDHYGALAYFLLGD